MITIAILVVVYILSGVICHYTDKKLGVCPDEFANWTPLLNSLLAALGIMILLIVKITEYVRRN